MSKPEHYTTAPEDRIPIIQKAAYAVGMLVNNMQAAALGSMMVILNLGLGMNPALVGTYRVNSSPYRCLDRPCCGPYF